MQQSAQQEAIGPAWLSLEGYKANSFAELAEIGIAKISQLGTCGIVCGPISTGGFGNAEQNFRAFGLVIDALKGLGMKIFDQRPYEQALGKLRLKWEEGQQKPCGYCMPILEEFYAPVFDTCLVERAWFLPGWESSTGAKWEHEHLHDLGARFRYVDQQWLASVLV